MELFCRVNTTITSPIFNYRTIYWRIYRSKILYDIRRYYKIRSR